MQLQKRVLNRGFTLVEISVTLVIVGLISITAFNFFVSNLRVNARTEGYQRQRKNWQRTTRLIESEVSLAENVITDLSKITIPNSCQALFNVSDFLFGLEIRPDLYQVLYAVADSDLNASGVSDQNSGWFGVKSLWRCGPSFDIRGQYVSLENESTNSPVPQRLIDGITSNGFSIDTDNTSGKHLTFTLSLDQPQTTNQAGFSFSDTISANTRNNPLYTRPNPLGLCSYNSGTLSRVDPDDDTQSPPGTLSAENSTGSSVIDGKNILVCGLGQVDSIIGTRFDDLIEAGGLNTTTIYGCDGADVIEGTEGKDNLYGDSPFDSQGNLIDNVCPGDLSDQGNDIIIGNGNNGSELEILNGGNGYNEYFPGYGNFKVVGGTNLDIVYFADDLTNGNSSNFLFDEACNRTSCTVTDNTDSQSPKTLELSGIEILVFRDQRKDLD